MVPATAQEAKRTSVGGTLTCNMSPGVGMIVAGQRHVPARAKPKDGLNRRTCLGERGRMMAVGMSVQQSTKIELYIESRTEITKRWVAHEGLTCKIHAVVDTKV
jgi:hypothetical protein